MKKMENLTEIIIRNCPNCSRLPPLGDLPHLKSLRLGNLDRLEYIVEEEIRGQTAVQAKFLSLEYLRLESLPNVKGLVKEEVGELILFPNLERLDTDDYRLLIFPFSKLENLSRVALYFTKNTRTCKIPEESMEDLCNLKELWISNAGEYRLPEKWFRGLKSLTGLDIYDSNIGTGFPEGWSRHLTALEELRIGGCKELVEVPEDIKYLYLLKHLTLWNLPKMVSLPQGLQHVTSLQSLKLWDLPQLASLLDWLGDLTSLTKLDIGKCPGILSLPSSIQGMTKLECLTIVDCPQLERRCEKQKGEDWHKIAHIPLVHIGFEHFTGEANFSTKQREFESSLSKTERSKHHEESILCHIEHPRPFKRFPLSDDESEVLFSDESTEKGMSDTETEMSSDMQSSVSEFDWNAAELAFYREPELQVLHEKPLTGAENFSSAEQSEVESISSETDRSKHHGENILSPIKHPHPLQRLILSDDQSEQPFSDEITEESMTQEDSKTKMFGHMPISVNDFDSQKTVESASSGEIQVVHETPTLKGAESFSTEQREIESTSSGTERSQHHEENILSLITEKEHYLVIMEDNLIKLELDHQTILIGDCQSSATTQSSPVNAALNLVEKDLRELPEKPDYPSSMLLFLQRNKHLTLIHSSFFDSMPDLRFLDLSDTRIRKLPSSLFKLSKLKVLMLRNCVCLENLPSEIGKLNHMEVLDLSGTELYNLPDEIGQLTLLKHMQLSFYGPDVESEYEHLPSQLVSPSFLSELTELHALSITVHPDDHRWTSIAAFITKDVGKLEMLGYLQFYFPEAEMFVNFIQMSPSWGKHKLRKFNFIVGHNVKRIVSRVPDEVESSFDQQDKCLRFVNGEKVTQVIKTVLNRVTAFYLDHHIEIKSLSEFGISNVQALKFFVARECPKLEVILADEKAEGAFPCLEYLGVYYLWELKHIWKPAPPPGRLKRILKTPLPSGNFRALKYLIVNTCPKLRFIFWECMLQCLSNLEELVVEDCECMEKIIKEESRKMSYNDVMLPGLRRLVLHYLPELVSLGNGLCLSEEKISVHACPKLILKSQPRKQRKFLCS